MKLNKDIFETIYYGALEASAELARDHGPYSTYEGSPVSQGILQPDMWDVPTNNDLWDWTALRQKVAQWGIRNSLLLAPMPTASTAQIMGNNESTEPFTTNMYNRRVLAGEFTIVNKVCMIICYTFNTLTTLNLNSFILTHFISSHLISPLFYFSLL